MINDGSDNNGGFEDNEHIDLMMIVIITSLMVFFIGTLPLWWWQKCDQYWTVINLRCWLCSYILRWKFRRKKWTTYIPDNNKIDNDDYPDEDNDNVNMHQKWTIPDDDYDVNVLCAVINGSQIGDTFHLRLAQKTDDDEA